MHDAESILKAFQRSVKLAKRLPEAGPDKISDAWPAVLQINYEGYVPNSKAPSGLTAAELQEFNRTCSWASFIREEVYRRILWAYAAGVSAGDIAKAIGPSIPESTIALRIVWSLAFIQYKVEHGETPPAHKVSAAVAIE